MSGTLDEAIIDRAVSYHGSMCPGLALGIQAARLALREVGRASEDNRVVATCAACGEVVMETRARARRGQTLCVPRFNEALAAGPRHRRRPEAMAGV